jgi:hypothetical protein
MNDCLTISLTPTRNERWVIRHFLAAANCWANHIVVADQGSVDGTRDVLQTTETVTFVDNDSAVFDEKRRQHLLIDRARQFPGKRILIALDADEALSANVRSSVEWQRVLAARPGTVLRFRWVNILPGFKTAWIPRDPTPFGFIDDGSEHTPSLIHSRRVPWPAGAAVIDLEDVVVLHFQYLAWDRMVSKHRWYQAWEHLTHRQKGPLDIFRAYHHMYGSWDRSDVHPVRSEWLEGYDRAGIDFRTLKGEAVTWWDSEVVQMLRDGGPESFRKLAIWDQDWNTVADRVGLAHGDLSDPRSVLEKIAHRVLLATQGHRGRWPVRAFERCLRIAGW